MYRRTAMDRREELERRITEHIWKQVRSRVSGRVRDQVWERVENQVWAQVAVIGRLQVRRQAVEDSHGSLSN